LVRPDPQAIAGNLEAPVLLTDAQAAQHHCDGSRMGRRIVADSALSTQHAVL